MIGTLSAPGSGSNTKTRRSAPGPSSGGVAVCSRAARARTYRLRTAVSSSVMRTPSTAPGEAMIRSVCGSMYAIPVSPGAALLTMLSRATRNAGSATESATFAKRSRAATSAPSRSLTWLLTSSASALALSSAALRVCSCSRSIPLDRSRANRKTRPSTTAKAPSGIRSAYLPRLCRMQWDSETLSARGIQPEIARNIPPGQLSRTPRAGHLPAEMKRICKHLLLCCALMPAACSPVYVIRAGFEEAKILSRRRPISSVIEDPGTSGETRRKLQLVLQARDFAEHALSLAAGESYTTYSYVDSDTLLLVVSAARKDRFEAYTWWFPIVGRVPYKGFFHFDAAQREAARLEAAGYDTYVRPSGAFSTLGWFNDPLLNTLLRYDDVSLVSTVLHELLHNTVYIPSQIAFNETFANFVGDRGVIEFFCARDGETAPRCRLARDAWADNLRYAAFLSG